jgi:glycosyltransferase involved in cell wall biosynthesis
VVTVHDVAYARHPEDFDPLWRRFALRAHRNAVKHAGAVIAVSHTTARDTAAWLRAPAERIVVARHGPGQDLHATQERATDHFLYVGDDEPRKNVARLREAHARYRSNGGSHPLVIAGPAGGKRVSPHELADLYSRAVALVHPSRDEGFGLTVLEAMSLATPVIAVRNAAIEELAGEAALIIDDSELAEAMQRVERDPPLQQTMGLGGSRRAAEFSWQRSAEAHIEAYTLARESR